MATPQRFDPRLSAMTEAVRDMASPQRFYSGKAQLRFERLDGVVHLYRHKDILAINYNNVAVRMATELPLAFQPK